MDPSTIDTFLEEFWPVPEICKEPYFSDKVKRNELLVQTYGHDKVEEFDRLLAAMMKTLSDEDERSLMDFVYATRMAEAIAPLFTMTTRHTLRGLLDLMQQVQPGARIADLGSGTGRIALGVAAGLDQVARVYAIDRSPGALEYMEECRGALPARLREASAKVIPVCADYGHADAMSELRKREPSGFDIVIASHIFRDEAACAAFNALAKPQGVMVLECPVPPRMVDGYGIGDAGFYVATDFNIKTWKNGVHYESMKTVQTASGFLGFFRGRRATRHEQEMSYGRWLIESRGM